MRLRSKIPHEILVANRDEIWNAIALILTIGRQRLAGAVTERWLPNKTESSAVTVHAGTI
jgi:hypothetical protein